MERKVCKTEVSGSIYQWPEIMSPSWRRPLYRSSYLFLCLSLAAPVGWSQLAQQNSTPTAANLSSTQKQNQTQPPQEPQTQSAGAPVDSKSFKVGPADVLNIRV